MRASSPSLLSTFHSLLEPCYLANLPSTQNRLAGISSPSFFNIAITDVNPEFNLPLSDVPMVDLSRAFFICWQKYSILHRRHSTVSLTLLAPQRIYLTKV